MKIKPEKLDNDIIELLIEQQILMHKTKLEQLFNKEFKFEEIINVDDTVNDFIHTSKKLGVPIHDDFLWKFVQGKTIQNSWEKESELPVDTKESDTMSMELISRGFKFIGTTICDAFMQVVGMVNDHTRDCFQYSELS